jgi:hypothetical protein
LPDVLSGQVDGLTSAEALPDVLSGQLDVVTAAVEEGTFAAGSVSGGAEPLPDALAAQADALLAEIVGDAGEGLVQTVAGVVEPVSGTVSGQADALTGTFNGVAGGAAQSVTGAAEPATGAVGPASDALSGQAQAPLADIVEVAGGGTVEGDPSTVLGTGLAEVAEPASEGGGAFGGLPFEALPALTPGAGEALLLSAALATVAGLALAARASGPSPASVMIARFFLANAPPIPLRCTVGASTTRVSAAVARAAGSVGEGGVLGVQTSVGAPVGGVAGKVVAVRDEVRDGFMRGAGRLGTGSADDDATGNPLWLIAMMLGTVYVAFISACIWAYKQRWRLRR